MCDRSNILSMNGKVISRTCNTKFLGVILDESLKFRDHVTQLTCKLAKYIPILYRIRELLDRKCLKSLYYSLVFSNLIYCISAWGGCKENALHPIVMLQKRIVRIICGVPTLIPSAQLFRGQFILNMRETHAYMVGIFVYKSLTSRDTGFFLRRSDVTYGLRSSDSVSLVVPFTTISHSKQSIQFAGPKTFNSLPAHIRNLEGFDTFKRSLKRFLIMAE